MVLLGEVPPVTTAERGCRPVKRQKKNTERLKEVEVVKSRESSTGKGNF